MKRQKGSSHILVENSIAAFESICTRVQEMFRKRSSNHHTYLCGTILELGRRHFQEGEIQKQVSQLISYTAKGRLSACQESRLNLPVFHTGLEGKGAMFFNVSGDTPSRAQHSNSACLEFLDVACMTTTRRVTSHSMSKRKLFQDYRLFSKHGVGWNAIQEGGFLRYTVKQTMKATSTGVLRNVGTVQDFFVSILFLLSQRRLFYVGVCTEYTFLGALGSWHSWEIALWLKTA